MGKFSASEKWLMIKDGPPAEAIAISPTLHCCPEWDGLVIEEGDPEYESCVCDGYGSKVHR